MQIDPSLILSDRGPSIGIYRDYQIAEWIMKCGERFDYDRIAMEDEHGAVPLAQLRDDEFVVAPGLIYRRAT
jgi:hypothetical protein